MADRSRSRGREWQSTGRGGAGNFIRSESVSRAREDGTPGQERGREILPANKVTHSGRGGAGNIRSPSRNPEDDIRALSREREIIESHRQSEEDHVQSTGRGGFGNMDRSRSRDRNPSTSTPHEGVHSSGRGGLGNIAHGDGHHLAGLEEEERAQHAHPPESHLSGRGGAGNLLPGAGPAPEHVTRSHTPESAQLRSTGRGGAGNIAPVGHADSHGAAGSK